MDAVERRKLRADAVRRFRARKRTPAGEEENAGCELRPRGRPPTKTPGRRTVQRLLKDLRGRLREAGMDEGLNCADAKRHAHIVMTACQFVPEARAARGGFLLQASADLVRMGDRTHGKWPRKSIKRSTIPGAGAGVFVEEDVSKNAIVAEYWGALTDRDSGLKLRDAKEDTHLRTLGYATNLSLDGRLTESMPIETYLEGHRVGSFINYPPEGVRANCEYIIKAWAGSGLQHGPAGVTVDDRVFLKMTRDVRAGEELFVNYGNDYASLHL